MKDDILKCIRESIDLLEQIPVTETTNCWRKVQIHDRLAAVYNAIAGAELKEETDGTETAQTEG